MKVLNKLLTKMCVVLCLLFSSGVYAYDNKQRECLAKNAYFEARGQGDKGMLGTVFVVLNRVKDGRFPDTPCKVIHQPSQFSWVGKQSSVKEPEMYSKAKKLVNEVLDGKHKDVTSGAIYFNALHRKPTPKAVCTTRIKDHSFYK